MSKTEGKLCILVDRPRFSAAAEGKISSGYEWSIIEERLRRNGLTPAQYGLESISSGTHRPTSSDYERCLRVINAKDYSVIVPLDETALQFTTEHRGIRKWHLSPLDAKEGFRARKVVPSFHPDQIRKEYHLGVYLEMAIQKAAKDRNYDPWKRKRKNFLLDPSYDETISILERLRNEPWLSIDIETGRSQINTFGFAWTPSDAIAIKLLPDGLPTAAHFKIWKLIAELCEGPAKKIMQNGIYERMCCSRYGFHINNFAHDTMCTMRLLYPDLEKGLDNVGRIFTNEPYWKDMGRVASEEGKQKDWGNIRDWPQHLLYNCLDSANTMEAAFNQQQTLKERGLEDVYKTYLHKLYNPTAEMALQGLPLNRNTQGALLEEYDNKAKRLISELSEEINPRSPKQVISFLTNKGIKLKKKRDKNTGALKPSADELSLKKARLQHPEDKDIQILLEYAKVSKMISSYLKVGTFADNLIRAQIDPFSTKTGRMASTKNPWDGGFNIQTMSKKVKAMIEWPEDMDRVFMDIDLGQAESRFVAYDACEETLLGMLERKEDIHTYVAAEIYTKPMGEITHAERQLGKKSGHGANYSMGASTFQDSCLKEMDLVLDRKMATKVLEAYHTLFPGIRNWHASIRDTLYRERKLSNPLGLERQFFGRMDDTTFRDAYAWKPQSTIPMITNYLMFGLCDQRTEGAMDFALHAQTHDSITLSCKTRYVEKITAYAHNLTLWHPEVILPAGKLYIPVEVEAGKCLGKLEEIQL